MTRTRVIVNADDFGMSRGITDGIIFTHRYGIVTSTSLVANMPAAEYALERVAKFPNLGVGVHLNICAGKPILPINKVRSLVGSDGQFHPPRVLIRRLCNGGVRQREIFAEFCAQIRWMKHRGYVPTHADSHHHMHLYPAAVLPFVHALKSEGLFRARAPRCAIWSESAATDLAGRFGGPYKGSLARRLLVRMYRSVLQFVAFRALSMPSARLSLRSRDRHNPGATGKQWAAALLLPQPGTFELTCHPGFFSSAAFPRPTRSTRSVSKNCIGLLERAFATRSTVAGSSSFPIATCRNLASHNQHPTRLPRFHEPRGKMLILFWTSFALVAYVYFGYPLVLWLAARKRPRPLRRANPPPTVSIIVAAHNEESCIEAKLRNLLALDYPHGKVEILIGSDGSSDRTEEIVRRYQSEGVGLVSFPQQHGKSPMQNSLVAFSSGAILVFTDADCLLAPSAVTQLLDHFADPRVGLVSACPRFRNTAESAITGNEGVYLRYETWIRERESSLGVLAMASGSLFAIRRSLWQPLAPHFGDDFVLPLRVLRAGFVNRLDTNVIAATDLSQSSPAAMFRMKTRIIAKDFRALLAHRDLLNPLRYGSVSVSLWSHKVLRWLVPYFLLAIFAANTSLLSASPYRLILVLQSGFYLLALSGYFFGNRLTRRSWSIPMSFCLVNFAALIGTLRACAGRPSGAWTPERRSPPTPDLRSPSPTRVAK